MIDKQIVNHIIKKTPYTDLLNCLLARCNLSKREQDLINFRVREGMTQEQYAEKIEKSPRHVREMEDIAYKKIIANWSQLDFIKYL